jgi:methylated-DNA-[protein]-cysteine S-methyltransferase
MTSAPVPRTLTSSKTHQPSTGDDADLRFTTVGSPVGELTIVTSDAGLRFVLWEGEHVDGIDLGDIPRADDDPILVAARAQLTEYFAGERKQFDLPLDVVGTPFQRSVWLGLAEIPYGTTSTYGEQATRHGDPNLARAVGAANGRNPVSIVLPCHRVIGANGALVGFAGGLPAKRLLLDLEQGITSLV